MSFCCRLVNQSLNPTNALVGQTHGKGLRHLLISISADLLTNQIKIQPSSLKTIDKHPGQATTSGAGSALGGGGIALGPGTTRGGAIVGASTP